MKKFFINLYWKIRAWIWIKRWEMWVFSLHKMDDAEALRQIENTRLMVAQREYTDEWRNCFNRALATLECNIKCKTIPYTRTTTIRKL